MSAPTATHIHVDQAGRAWIDDTNVKVLEVATAKLAYGWSPEEIHFQHPHLSLAQIHAALTYYYENQSGRITYPTQPQGLTILLSELAQGRWKRGQDFHRQTPNAREATQGTHIPL